MRRILLASSMAIAIPSLAHADLFVSGSSFNVNGTSSPTDFSQNVNLTPGTTLIDNGQLSLTISIVTSGIDEWLVFNYATVGNVPLSQPGSDWSVNETGLQVGGQAINFVSAYGAWFINGVTTTPTASIFGGYTPGASPVPGDTSYGLVSGTFVDPIAAGTAIGSLGAYINPYSYLGSTGIDYTAVTGWEQALEFVPQNPLPVPEPISIVLLGTGLAGLGLAKRRLARNDA